MNKLKRLIINHLVVNNPANYNLLKAVEELQELSLVLTQRITKEGGPKEPSYQSVVDEIGDVEIRLTVLKKLFGKKEVSKRVQEKCKKLLGYIEEGKYRGTL